MSEEDKRIPPYFYFNKDYHKYLDLLTDEEAGQAIKYLGHYAILDEELPDIKTFSPIVSMFLEIATSNIDKCYKGYFARVENGKKGGAPKSNKNAVKVDWQELPTDERNDRIGLVINEEFYNQCKSIDKVLKKMQMAEAAACMYLCDLYSFSELGLSYKTLEEAVLNESAAKMLKMLRAYAQDEFEETDKESFSMAFADCKQRAITLLKLPHDDLHSFLDKCYELEEEKDRLTENNLKTT